MKKLTLFGILAVFAFNFSGCESSAERECRKAGYGYLQEDEPDAIVCENGVIDKGI